ncbi:MAG: DUF6273 domain-containing protein [Treponema sp.]|jgi:hypothetical protein|nr:DUF6273 domain-containing protein [Treponema sp.]
MKCPHCNSEWKTDDKRSSSLTSCPFCGKSLVKEEAPKKHDNSKDALAAIMEQFGPDVLLGKLNAHFPDLASVPDANSGDYLNERRKGSMGYRFSNNQDGERAAKDENGKACWWWLRSPGIYRHYAAGVNDDGGVKVGGTKVNDSRDRGVRPALWLKL